MFLNFKILRPKIKCLLICEQNLEFWKNFTEFSDDLVLTTTNIRKPFEPFIEAMKEDCATLARARKYTLVIYLPDPWFFIFKEPDEKTLSIYFEVMWFDQVWQIRYLNWLLVVVELNNFDQKCCFISGSFSKQLT